MLDLVFSKLVENVGFQVEKAVFEEVVYRDELSEVFTAAVFNSLPEAVHQ